MSDKKEFKKKYETKLQELQIELVKLQDWVIDTGKKIAIVFGCGGDRDKFKRPRMGEIVNEFCNKIYLTDDNPRKENPKK